MTTLRGEFVGGRQQDLITPKFKVETDAFGNQTLVPKEIISLSAQKQLDKSSESIKQSLKLTDEFVKANRNVMRTAALFSGMVGQLKGKAIEQKGLGLIPGLKGRFGLFTKQPGFGRTAGFEGQEKETAIALNSILTGQNRVIKSVVEMIEATLPGDLDPEDVAASKISQSLTNAFKLNLSFKKGLLSPDKIEALSEGNEAFDLQRELSSIVTLSPKDQETLDSIIENILNTPATKKQTLFPGGQFKETERGVSGLSDEELDRQIAEAESKIKGR